VDLSPVVSHTFPMLQARQAFELASDRKQAMKVLIDFADTVVETQ
jgi:L-idonate 5-dehydrogenase